MTTVIAHCHLREASSAFNVPTPTSLTKPSGTFLQLCSSPLLSVSFLERAPSARWPKRRSHSPYLATQAICPLVYPKGIQCLYLAAELEKPGSITAGSHQQGPLRCAKQPRRNYSQQQPPSHQHLFPTQARSSGHMLTYSLIHTRHRSTNVHI